MYGYANGWMYGHASGMSPTRQLFGALLLKRLFFPWPLHFVIPETVGKAKIGDRGFPVACQFPTNVLVCTVPLKVAKDS